MTASCHLRLWESKVGEFILHTTKRWPPPGGVRIIAGMFHVEHPNVMNWSVPRETFCSAASVSASELTASPNRVFHVKQCTKLGH